MALSTLRNSLTNARGLGKTRDPVSRHRLTETREEVGVVLGSGTAARPIGAALRARRRCRPTGTRAFARLAHKSDLCNSLNVSFESDIVDLKRPSPIPNSHESPNQNDWGSLASTLSDFALGFVRVSIANDVRLNPMSRWLMQQRSGPSPDRACRTGG
jgi:hypothetical protein